MSKWAQQTRIREVIAAIATAQNELRHASISADILAELIADMPEDPPEPVLPDGTEPPPENTYAEGP